MIVFSEKVQPTFTSSDHNVIIVENFEEVFFDVFEIEINGKKFVAEKIGEENGSPIVNIPTQNGANRFNVPFIVEKGNQLEIFYNEQRQSEYEVIEEIANTGDSNIIESVVEALEERKSESSFFKAPVIEETIDNVNEIKKSASDYLKRMRLEYIESQKKEIDEYDREKTEEFQKINEKFRENMVAEFYHASEVIKEDLLAATEGERSSYNAYITETLNDFCRELDERSQESYETAISIFEEKIETLTNNIFVDKIQKILEDKVDTFEKVIETKDDLIHKQLDSKLKKSLLKIIEGVESKNSDLEEIVSKNTNRALSRIGNVKTELHKRINEEVVDFKNIEEGLKADLKKYKSKTQKYFDDKIKLVENNVTGLHEKHCKEIESLIEDSKQNILDEIEDIDRKLPTLILQESKSGKNKDNVEVSLEDIRKELEGNISNRFNKEIVSLKRLIEMTSGGGGAGGSGGGSAQTLSFNNSTYELSITDGNSVDLSVLAITGTDLTGLSGNWESTYLTVQANSALWDTDQVGSIVYNLSGNWESAYTTLNANSADWAYVAANSASAGSDVSTISGNWESTYSTVSVNSADWESFWERSGDVLTTVNANDNVRVDGTTFLTELSATTNNTITVPSTGLNIGTHSVPLSAIHATEFHFETNIDSPQWEEGMMFYDNDDKTVTLYTDISDVGLQVGQEMWTRVVNKTGSTVNNGDVVYVDGAQGNRPTIALASSEDRETSTVIGIATHDILDNQEGYITTSGLVRDLNTSSFTAGDTLYVSNTAGIITNIPQITPLRNVRVGFCITAHLNQGIILVNIDNPGVLDNVHDVLYTQPSSAFSDNTILAWSTGVSGWQDNSILPNKWQSNYTTVNTNSADWSYVAANSAHSDTTNGESSYTTVNTNSADWSYVAANSAHSDTTNGESSYTTVNANSADWAYVAANSAHSDTTNGESAYTTLNSNSGDWEGTETTVRANSGSWAAAGSTNFYSSLGSPQLFNPVASGVSADQDTFTLSTSYDVGFVTHNGQVLAGDEYSQSTNQLTVTPDNGFTSTDDEILVFQTTTPATSGGLVLGIVSDTSTSYTVQDDDYTILIDASTGNTTVQLPAASGISVGKIYNIKKTDSSTNTVIVSGNSTETIDESNTATITVQYETINIQSDGSNWWIL